MSKKKEAIIKSLISLSPLISFQPPFFHSNKNKDLARSPIVHLGFSRQDVEDRIDESRNKRGKILEESMDGDSKFGTSLNYREGIVVEGGVFGRDGNVSSQLKVKVERMSPNISDRTPSMIPRRGRGLLKR